MHPSLLADPRATLARLRLLLPFLLALPLALGAPRPAVASDPGTLRVLFLGDNGHHQPAARFKQLQPVLAARGP